MPEPAVAVSELRKHFGTATALAGIDLEVPAGQFLTIFGPNGAGKTTLMRIVSTLARPSGGAVSIFGEEARRARADIRRRIGLVTHRSLLYTSLSAFENVAFFARMFGVDDPGGRARTILADLGLRHRMDDPVSTYSRGMEQRSAIARALVHEPDILLLDEPFSGLDPDASGRLHDLLAGYAGGGRTVILTSHDLGRGAALADRVAILARGRLVYDAPAADVGGESMATLYREHTGGNAR